jgi:hypothetical protein
MSRDYRGEMNDLLAVKVPEADYIAGVVAAELVAWLDANDPDLLVGWLREMAPSLLTDVIGLRARGLRARAQRHASASAFAEAAARFESTNDAECLSVFRVTCVVSEDNLRRAVGDMTRDDHLFVASTYDRTAATAQMEAAFHRAVAKRLTKGQRTSDAMDEDTYLRLRDSIARKPAA